MKYKERIVKWYNKEKERAEKSELTQVRMFASKSKINVENSAVDMIKRWITNVKDIEKKAEKLPKNDIRRYFELC